MAHSCYQNKPVNTRDTAVRVHGVSRCAKMQHCTRTRVTRFGRTAGLPAPVQKPTCGGIIGSSIFLVSSVGCSHHLNVGYLVTVTVVSTLF